jgi:hypothetical protein
MERGERKQEVEECTIHCLRPRGTYVACTTPRNTLYALLFHAYQSLPGMDIRTNLFRTMGTETMCGQTWPAIHYQPPESLILPNVSKSLAVKGFVSRFRHFAAPESIHSRRIGERAGDGTPRLLAASLAKSGVWHVIVNRHSVDRAGCPNILNPSILRGIVLPAGATPR